MSEEPTEEEKAAFDRVARRAADDMYMAIGKCITIWSKMEGSLVTVAAILLGTQREKAGLILYSINNFHTWLSIIDELFVLDPRYTPVRSEWIKISKRLVKCNDTRVVLAHHALTPGKGLEHFMETDDLEAVFPTLKPNRFDSRARSKKRMPLGLDELLLFATELGAALIQINEMLDQMQPLIEERYKRLQDGLQVLREKLDERDSHREAIRNAFGG